VQVQDVRELAREQRLLRDLVAVVRRADGRLPEPVLDAVLAGTCAVRPVLPPRPRSGSGRSARVRPPAHRPA
jgi:hypothetical protein